MCESREDLYSRVWASAKAGEKIHHNEGDLVVWRDQPNIVARVVRREGKNLVIDSGGGSHHIVHQKEVASQRNCTLMQFALTRNTSNTIVAPEETLRNLVAALQKLRR